MSDASSPSQLEKGQQENRRRANEDAAGADATLSRLNVLWRIVDAPVTGGTLKARLAGVARQMMGRILARQQEFNANVVDYMNRSAALKVEDVLQEMTRHREALLARERRSETAVSQLAAAQQDLRSAISTLQQATQNLKREIERTQHVAPAVAAAPGGVSIAAAAVPASQFETLDSHKYVGFEDQFRGSAEDIRKRVSEYLPVFAGCSDVLDVGCGRGEFLDLLRQHGVSGRGIDLNPAMVEVCREHGLDATATDALTYLRSQPDGSLGGLFAAQVVEHLEPRYLTQLLDAAFDKLRPGAPIVLETINPACWFAFFESYIRDITHVRPLHPETLKYLLIASGFQQVDIRYRAPYPEHEKLQRLGGTALNADWADTLNANIEKINSLLFTWLDYAAIGRRA